ncbi:MAG: M1 family metallopeptidase [Bacteroidia bacterium]|jgi:aminopeptidase N
MRKLFGFLLLLPACALYAQAPDQTYLSDGVSFREHPLDITRMKVEVHFEPVKGLVKGKVTHHFTVLQERVDSFFFDAPGITIHAANLGNEKLPFSQTKQGLWLKPVKPLTWDQTGQITFVYEATPRRGLYFIGWKDTVGIDSSNPFSVRKQIWTQGQGIDNRNWIPMYDDMNDKFITETVITFDNAFQVLSNGTLLKKTPGPDNTTVWHYSMTKPHAGYLLMLAIGKYAVNTSKTKNGVTLNNWYYPEFKDRAEPTYRYTAEMMNFLEKETGIPYPWESYSQVMVQDFIYGAMENTTATIFGDFFNVDERAFPDRNYVGVNCHEMTHQWFGDYITARDGRDSWLQESFATYWPKQFSKVNEGYDEWSWQRRAHQNAAVEAGKKDNFPVRHSQGGTARAYPKGAAVISMLEYVLGEEQWKRALNHYLKTHAYGNVETNDLKQAIQDKLGRDLSWFFDEWILRGGEPHYRVHYEDLTYANGARGTEIAIEQIHKTDETVRWFDMPIEIEVVYADGSSDKVKTRINEQFEVVKIQNASKKKIDYVLFDPNSNILKQVTFNKNIAELLAQAEKSKYMLDRYDAMKALKEANLDQKRAVLLASLKKETHHGIVHEIIGQLITDQNTATVSMLQEMAKNRMLKPSIREQILKNIKPLDATWKGILELALTDPSYEVMRVSMERLSHQYADESTILLILEKTKDAMGMHNAIDMKRHEITLQTAAQWPAFKDRAILALQSLQNYASPHFEFRTRIMAFNTLKSLNQCDKITIQHLFQAMLSHNGRLAAPAAQVAEYFSSQANYRQMMQKYFNTGEWTAAEKEQLKKQLNFL